MANIVNFPLASSMQLLTVSNKITKPQDGFFFRPMPGVDKDGETIRVVDMETEFKNNYFVLFFFPMDFKVDSSEVLSFKEHHEEFTKNHCQIVGVTSYSPLAVKRWISKDVSRGGFGGPVGFSILTDKDLSLSMSMGVARVCGAPARATFIIDWTGTVRYMMVHRSDIGRSVKEILRLVQAFGHSDLTGEALASGWIPDGEVIPTDFSKKVEYFVNKFGHGNKDATETAMIEALPEDEVAGSGKAQIKSEDDKPDTKSKVVIAEVHTSEAAAEDEVSAASFKSAEMSPAAETEAQKSPASAQKVTSKKPADAKSVTNSRLKDSDPKAEAVVEEEKKVEK